MTVKIFSAFSGYGGFEFAFKKSNISHKIVGHSEIDKYANKIYDLNHPNIKNYGDITKINPEDLPDFDLLTGGFPCQAFSLAGKRKGFEDTRGTLVYDLLRIAKVKKPKYLFFENVKGLLNHDNGNTFKTIIYAIRSLGYDVIYDVLNSKDFGIPQNRERIWIVCKLGKWDFMEFRFPNKKELKLSVKDILEPKVEQKYTLSDKMVKTILSRNRKEGFDIAPTITSNCAKGNEATPIFPLSEEIPKPYRVYNTNGIYPTISTIPPLPAIVDNQRVNPEIAHTLTAGANSTGLHSDMDIFSIDNCKFRRLTPRECFRLMGFLNDEIKFGNLSNAQLYKLAGNGCEVNLLSQIVGGFKWN